MNSRLYAVVGKSFALICGNWAIQNEACIFYRYCSVSRHFLQDQLAESKERYKQASGGVTDRSRTLAEVRAKC